ncbi:MAG: DUF167 domain-containing protein [Tepidisphaeraceae bacterium]|jgi:uncharacterized protein (TIGR00251 family)
MPLHLTLKSDGFALAVKVVPGASRQSVVGEYGGGIKVAVTAAPQAGAANGAVVELLAGALSIPRTQVQITRGQSSPRKEVFISGLAAEVIEQRLLGASKS